MDILGRLLSVGTELGWQLRGGDSNIHLVSGADSKVSLGYALPGHSISVFTQTSSQPSLINLRWPQVCLPPLSDSGEMAIGMRAERQGGPEDGNLDFSSSENGRRMNVLR